MLFIVRMYIGGRIFEEEVYAGNREDAIETAKARNPKANVLGVNVKF